MFYFIKKSTGADWEGGEWEDMTYKTETGAKRAATAMLKSDKSIERVFVGSDEEREPLYINHEHYKTAKSAKWLKND